MRVGVDAPRLTRGVSLGRTQRDAKQCQQADLLLVALCALRQLVQQREAASRQHCRFARRRPLGVVTRGKLVILDCLGAHAGALEVGRDLARVLRDPVPVADDQPMRDRRVSPASLPRALPVVSRLGEELMTEAKRGRHGAVGPSELATDEREAILARDAHQVGFYLVFVRSQHCCDVRRTELGAGNAAGLEQVDDGRIETLEPGLDEFAQRARNRAQVLDQWHLAGGLRQPAVYRYAHEKRLTGTVRPERVDRRRVSSPAEARLEVSADCRRVERTQLDALGEFAHPEFVDATLRLCSGTSAQCADHEKARDRGASRRVVQPVERRRIGPLQIFEHEHGRRVVGECNQRVRELERQSRASGHV